jgi:hypothetical protein
MCFAQGAEQVASARHRSLMGWLAYERTRHQTEGGLMPILGLAAVTGVRRALPRDRPVAIRKVAAFHAPLPPPAVRREAGPKGVILVIMVTSAAGRRC